MVVVKDSEATASAQVQNGDEDLEEGDSSVVYRANELRLKNVSPRLLRKFTTSVKTKNRQRC